MLPTNCRVVGGGRHGTGSRQEHLARCCGASTSRLRVGDTCDLVLLGFADRC